VTFDTAVLIALERRRQRAWQMFRRLYEHGTTATVPLVVVGEWWRGRTDVRDDILSAVVVEAADVAVMKAAGEALAAVTGATLVDAVVMASAARRNDDVLTADLDDLTRLRAFFPGVRVLAL
jgi:predicted nucleic acid-binding protein